MVEDVYSLALAFIAIDHFNAWNLQKEPTQTQEKWRRPY
jgi:hypothetical protein